MSPSARRKWHFPGNLWFGYPRRERFAFSIFRASQASGQNILLRKVDCKKKRKKPQNNSPPDRCLNSCGTAGWAGCTPSQRNSVLLPVAAGRIQGDSLKPGLQQVWQEAPGRGRPRDDAGVQRWGEGLDQEEQTAFCGAPASKIRPRQPGQFSLARMQLQPRHYNLGEIGHSFLLLVLF